MVFYQLQMQESSEYYDNNNNNLIMFICVTYSTFYSHSDYHFGPRNACKYVCTRL